MNITRSQLKRIVKEEIKAALNETDYAKLGLVQDVVYAAARQDVDKFEGLLKQLGFEVDPQFTNDQIMEIKSMLDDQSAMMPFEDAAKYVQQLVGMEL